MSSEWSGQRAELLIVAAFSRHADALAWAHSRLQEEFGPIAFSSSAYEFKQTTYYADVMGPNLQKLFHVFEKLLPAEQLAEAKRRTIAIEHELAGAGRFPEPRPLNLDPGMLGLGKFVLATTKDQQHRIYLRDGIFAEVTLRFQDGEYRTWPWTYADYQQPAVLEFMKEAREYYKQMRSV